MNLLPGRFRRRLREMVGADEEPSRLAAAWALGFAVAFSPFIGLHWLIAVVVAHVFRLNKLDAVIGTLVINPWSFAVYFPAAVLFGSWVTGTQVPHIVLPSSSELLKPEFWRLQNAWLVPLLTVWTIGALIASVLIGIASFLALRWLIEHHRRHHRT